MSCYHSPYRNIFETIPDLIQSSSFPSAPSSSEKVINWNTGLVTDCGEVFSVHGTWILRVRDKGTGAKVVPVYDGPLSRTVGRQNSWRTHWKPTGIQDPKLPISTENRDLGLKKKKRFSQISLFSRGVGDVVPFDKGHLRSQSPIGSIRNIFYEEVLFLRKSSPDKDKEKVTDWEVPQMNLNRTRNVFPPVSFPLRQTKVPLLIWFCS